VELPFGSLVVENLWLPTRRGGVDEAQAMRVARGTTLVLGLVALVVAINPPAAIYWIVTMGFSLMTSAFTFPRLLGLWWPRATHQGALAGMVGGVTAAALWYLASYVAHGSIDTFLGGIWPALAGPTVSLLLTVTVSRMTAPPSAEVTELFFG
jgi:Na+/proline symporter